MWWRFLAGSTGGVDLTTFMFPGIVCMALVYSAIFSAASLVFVVLLGMRWYEVTHSFLDPAVYDALRTGQQRSGVAGDLPPQQVYGRPDSLPVSEAQLVRPTDVNGINKAAGEYYHLVYNNVFGIRACSLRLTNVYGPRQSLSNPYAGVAAIWKPSG